MPGVSTNMIWAGPTIVMPMMRRRVVCTLGETIDTLVPTSLFSRVDLPTLGAPRRATKPARAAARSSACSHACAEQQPGRGLAARLRASTSGPGRGGLQPGHRTSTVKCGCMRRALGRRPAGRPAAPGHAPAPTPAARSWHRAAGPAAARTAPIRGATKRPRGLEPAVEIEGADQRPRSSRRRSAGLLRAAAARPRCAPSRSSVPSPIRCGHRDSGLDFWTSAAWRLGQGTLGLGGEALDQRCAMTRPRTRSPRNSSRSWRAPAAGAARSMALAWVSASVEQRRVGERDGRAPPPARPGARRACPVRRSAGSTDRPQQPVVADGERPLPDFPEARLAVDREEQDLGPADQVLERDEADMVDAAVERVVAIVAHGEDMAGRDLVDAGVVERAVRR